MWILEKGMKVDAEKVLAEEEEHHMFSIILGPYVFLQRNTCPENPGGSPCFSFGRDGRIKALRLIKLASLPLGRVRL